MAQIRLFGSPLSPFVKKVMDVLAFKKIDAVEIVEPGSPGDFKKWNPLTRKMPVLDIDGEKLYDSSFICARINELFQEPPLFSSDPALRAAQRMLEDWADESLYWMIMGMRWSPQHRDETLAQITGGMPALLRPVVRIALSRDLGKQAAAQGMGRLPLDVLLRELGERLDDLKAQISDRGFYRSEELSLGDIAVASQLEMGRGGPTREIATLINARPEIGAYLERVSRAVPAGKTQ